MWSTIVRLDELLHAIGLTPSSETGPCVVHDVTYDTRALKPGSLLVITASHLAHEMIQHLRECPPLAIILSPQHAAVLAAQRHKTTPLIPLYPHPSPHHALSVLAALFFPHIPETLVAVTGTNGKSSTVHFARSLWEDTGHRAASIGTLGIHSSPKIEAIDQAFSLTTPNVIDLRKILTQLASHAIPHVALEASSHGLHQYRIHGLPLKAAGFTQLSHDHLDYHKTFGDYFGAKARLFSECLPSGQTAVLNQDSPCFEALQTLCTQRGCPILAYGRGRHADLQVISATWTGQEYHLRLRLLNRTWDTTVSILGDFQLMNLLCAIGLLIGCGIDPEAMVEVLPKLQAPEGRLSYAGQAPGHGRVYIDYAHTPDSLSHVLKALRPLTSGSLRVVFGCGGNRDTAKRALMGQVAALHSDVAYITDDNPRHEDPASIRAQVLATCPKGIDTLDRTQAIQQAIQESGPQDTVLIAGKGHETSQVIGSQTLPFRDHDVVQTVIHTLQGASR